MSRKSLIQLFAMLQLWIGLTLLGSLYAVSARRQPLASRFGSVSMRRSDLKNVISIHRGGSSYAPQDDFAEFEAPAGMPGDRETVQDRVDAWRRQQQEMYSQQTPAQAANPRGADGRFKLMASVSKGSRALIFFLLMWRDVHLYEVADQVFKGPGRLLTVIPLIVLFIANLAGCVASLTSPSHSAKKRLKAILNLDKFVEVMIILFNFVRLTVAPSKYTPREVYIANTLHSVFFILQSQAFTKVSWDELHEARGATSDIGTSSQYDPYYGSGETSNAGSSYGQNSGSPYEQTGQPMEQQNGYGM
mmetsp:Transcript_441/g.658  ORF Transcript_441/g.658 Transcript_441/m.658 type:complete len:304 (+) Transcript_441:107-1018(+)